MSAALNALIMRQKMTAAIDTIDSELKSSSGVASGGSILGQILEAEFMSRVLDRMEREHPSIMLRVTAEVHTEMAKE